MSKLGFIITRNIVSVETSRYWIECCKCIRKFYPENIILVIDDNSKKEFLSDINLIFQSDNNITIINSEFPAAGELLSYYYFYKTKLFDRAVIIHDSSFIQKPLETENVEDIKFLWHFDHQWDENMQTLELIDRWGQSENSDQSENSEQSKQSEHLEKLKEFYLSKHLWFGCFGLQSVITYTFLEILVQKYNIFKFLEIVKSRPDRCALERVFAVICTYENNNIKNDKSMFGIIHDYLPWGFTYDQYCFNKALASKGIIKCWTGR